MEEKILSNEAVLALLSWYQENKRALPWRENTDPYRVWISEIMLQQTRVEAVKPYFARFMAELPTLHDLAEVSQEKLMKLWEGLGYYSRARNLQKAAQTAVEQYGGRLPNAYSELKRLSGIGDYTAGAIASIAFGERVPAIDGNVLRVLARVMGSYEDIALPQTKARFRELLLPIIPEAAGDFNQALIELGATVCVPNGEARCEKCPLSPDCRAKKEHLTDELPVKSAKKTRKIVKKTAFVIADENRVVLHKRPQTGLLAGLFEPPNTEGHLTEAEATLYLRSIGFEPLRILPIDDSKHIFTHLEWHMKAYLIRIAPDFDGTDESQGYRLIDRDDLRAHYAIPSAFSAYAKYLRGETAVDR